MTLEPAQQMLPHAGKRKMRLTDVERDIVISKEIQVQIPPFGRASIDEQEALERDRDVVIVHGEFQLTAGVSDGGAGVDSAWEQEKPEARKLPENGGDSHLSAARFVRQPHGTQDSLTEKRHRRQLNEIFTHN